MPGGLVVLVQALTAPHLLPQGDCDGGPLAEGHPVPAPLQVPPDAPVFTCAANTYDTSAVRTLRPSFDTSVLL